MDVAAYDAREAEAIRTLSYPAIRAFRPAAFGAANFPTRVTSESELIRYADIMNELDDRSLYYEQELYSSAEAALMRRISHLVEKITFEQFGRPIRPFMSLFAPIKVLRAVLMLSAGSPTRVFEIGPGSGFLGAYLMNAEMVFGDLSTSAPITYSATDNTQALYLWQSRFFAAACRSAFQELALTDGVTGPEINAHVPWWLFAELYRAPPPVDIVICDAALGEMDPFAANYVIRLAAEMLRNSDIGAFLYRHLGEQRLNSQAYIESRFVKAGFVKQQLGSVTAYSLKPLNRTIRPPPMGTAHDMQPAKEFLPVDRQKLLPSYEFFDFLRLLE